MDSCYSASRSAIVNGLGSKLKPGTIKAGYALERALFDGFRKDLATLTLIPEAEGSAAPITLSSGVHYDLVVGADGVHSRVATCIASGVAASRSQKKRPSSSVSLAVAGSRSFRRKSTLPELQISSSTLEVKNSLFEDAAVDERLLRQRAYNYRWASLPEGVLPLTAASTDFKVAAPIRDAVRSFMDDGYCSYGPNEGLPEFREELARFVSLKNEAAVRAERGGLQHAQGLGEGARVVSAEEVMVVNAAAAGVYHVAQRVLGEVGDEALVMTPVDFLLSSSISSLPGRVMRRYKVKVKGAEGSNGRVFFDLDEMEALISPGKTKMLSICNPHNPLGRAWSAAELVQLSNFAERHALSIFSDEVWGDFVFPPLVHIPMASVSEYAAKNTYTVVGFSKNFGLEGLRVGGLIAPSREELVACVEASDTATTAGGASTLSQVAAVAAMKKGVPWLQNWRIHLEGNIAFAVDRLSAIKGVGKVRKPDACFVVFIEIGEILKRGRCVGEFEDIEIEMALMQWLIKYYKVAIIPGLPQFFGPSGASGHLRIALATSRGILKEAFDRLEKGLNAWPEQDVAG